MANAFDLWWLGDASLKIRPFKKTKQEDFWRPKVKPGDSDAAKKVSKEGWLSGNRLSRWKGTFDCYEKLIKDDAGYVKKDPTAAQVTAMFNAAHKKAEDKIKVHRAAQAGKKRKRKSKLISPVRQYDLLKAAGLIPKPKKRQKK